MFPLQSILGLFCLENTAGVFVTGGLTAYAGLPGEKESLLTQRGDVQERLARQEAIKRRIGKIEDLWARIGRRMDKLTERERYEFLHAFISRFVVNFDQQTKEHQLHLELAVEIEEEILPPLLRSVLAHEQGRHTEAGYHETLTNMGGQLVIIALKEPEFFKV